MRWAPSRRTASPTGARRVGLVAAVTLALALPTAAPAAAAPVSNLVPPEVTGPAQVGGRLVADPGTWDPAEVTPSYRWLRDGARIRGADARRYRPVVADLGHEISVRVTATSGEDRERATSAPVLVGKGTFAVVREPRITGQRRYGHTLTVRPGTWSPRPARLRYQWLRAGREIRGATGRRHVLGLRDFGRRLSVRVTAARPGFDPERVRTGATRRIMHRVPARHTVTYRVETRGRIVASRAVFAAQAQQTFDDPRGWRGSGVRFRRVARGGAFSLVLSEAGTVPSFSSACSAEWSCRVGRYVVINQLRWRGATPMWNRAGKPLRGYRHMVVNHETGHWLGWGHRGCPRPGAPAPVMMQQSKNLDGCRANPWPTPAERDVPRF